MPLERVDMTGPAAFAEKGAELLAQRIRSVIAEHGTCTVGLSGGSTPGPVYAHLSVAEGIDWEKVFVFLLDERMVPADHTDSNHRLAWQTLCAPAHIPEVNMLFPDTTLGHEECASEYAQHLDRHFAKHMFDIAVIGMGPDGHITSLFPPLTPAATGAATVIPAFTPDQNGKPMFAVRERVSVTLPFLQRCRWTLFVLGAGKRSLWEEMQRSNEGITRWPAKALLDGNVTVLMEQIAR